MCWFPKDQQNSFNNNFNYSQPPCSEINSNNPFNNQGMQQKTIQNIQTAQNNPNQNPYLSNFPSSHFTQNYQHPPQEQFYLSQQCPQRQYQQPRYQHNEKDEIDPCQSFFTTQPKQQRLSPENFYYTHNPLAQAPALRYHNEPQRYNYDAAVYNLQYHLALKQLEKHCLETLLLQEQLKRNPYLLQFTQNANTSTDDINNSKLPCRYKVVKECVTFNDDCEEGYVCFGKNLKKLKLPKDHNDLKVHIDEKATSEEGVQTEFNSDEQAMQTDDDGNKSVCDCDKKNSNSTSSSTM